MLSMRPNLLFSLRIASLLALLLGVLPPEVGAQKSGACKLECRIDATLRRPAVASAEWGVQVRDVASGEVLYARGADHRMVPASNLKLVVAAAASHRLGPEFRYRTRLFGAGPLEGGTLRGDLVLWGEGDPTLSGRYAPHRMAVWEALADSLRALGIRRIAGNVTADETAWDGVQIHPDWHAGDLLWWYAAPVGPLGFNDNAIEFWVAPGVRPGDPARVTAVPSTSFFRLDNTVTTVGSGGGHTLRFGRAAGTNRIRVSGQVPHGAAPRIESVAVVDPARYAATTFRESLQRRGIEIVEPEVRVTRAGSSSAVAGAQLLVEHRSPALPQLIAPILLTSQNWFAEQMVKTLGRVLHGSGSWEAGLAVEKDFLTNIVGIDSTEFLLRDASGLSARNRITPAALVDILLFVRRDPSGRPVRDALPVSGRSGSLRNRLTDLPGRVAAKTGYIGGVTSLSGFVVDSRGREVAFSIIANGRGIAPASARAAIDDVVRAIATAER